MTNETREHLSCLMDGESGRDTSRFLVRRLSADSELRATWARYHLMRDCLRHKEGGLAAKDFCSRVNRALENEAAPRPGRAISRRWLKSFTGVAAAASVALMALVAVNPGSRDASEGQGDLVDNEPLKSFVSPQSLVPGPASRQASFSGAMPGHESRMNSYLLRHYQASGRADGRGFVSFVPIVITPVAVSATAGTEQEDSGAAQDTLTGTDGNPTQ
ncbi:MAG: sigma-E factor negative regulatory protein [Xanthomonadales bacterium]|nr:sigma-E factor negative regulatory protein [Xanthomonadales bacterium]